MSNYKWIFYQDNKKEWRWRKIASNGKTVGASSEGFSSKQSAVRNARLNGYKG